MIYNDYGFHWLNQVSNLLFTNNTCSSSKSIVFIFLATNVLQYCLFNMNNDVFLGFSDFNCLKKKDIFAKPIMGFMGLWNLFSNLRAGFDINNTIFDKII